ncbi:LysR family transcriptional regulator [Amycolatopsis rubida]|uniref:DNA-binding transcriptional LysR family regulator n=2 Tax=Amycolatopsis TaxID=1813 RepID=A0A2N3WP73_9PSEU|nr:MULTISPECIES: LysR family transcriptional regulator [Amycolatopsis]MYW93984.1 LysR family transcriptional regulator [Amycolatopsis rubida]NEC58973.1 LysR family transcriptional regulator [Amycolatopsis rubida]OAP26348.1 HTH-type transcriptional activator CmpR [Amycolatopsis sp. M39]PKV95667.1 DNA-binding transcriptional LysR family regulator [Amycolatopsis niigatensis]SFP38949.1 DNA-binding transcriptional regulator, LysR family [Amycolatopsis rubida]
MTTSARLRAFVAVAETGSVWAAARRLALTESAVSAAVSALSKDVGVPLVEREGRGVRLTRAGESYAGHARVILGLHEEAVVAARGEADPGSGLLRLAAVTTAGEHVLPSVLARFLDRHPRVELRLNVGTSDQVWASLANHDIDLAIGGRPPASVREARVFAVRDNELLVVAAPALAPAFDPATTTWLQREPGSGTRATSEALLAARDLDPPALTLGSNGAVVAGAVAGLGATLVSRDAVERQLASGELVPVPMAGTPLHRPWHAVGQRRLTAGSRLFVEHLCGAEDGWRSPGRSTARGSREDRSGP